MILSKSRWWARMALAGGVLACAGAAWGQSEAVLIKRVSQLREAPGESSKSLTSLPVQTSVTRLGERQGPWIKVRMADGTQGWVHMFDITAVGSAQGSNAGTGALRNITGFFNRGSAQGNAGPATSTLGIRGLGAEDIANSQPDPAAVTLLDASRLDAAQARQFAGTASLSSRTIEPLPAPSAPPRAAPPSGPAGGGNGQFGG